MGLAVVLVSGSWILQESSSNGLETSLSDIVAQRLNVPIIGADNRMRGIHELTRLASRSTPEKREHVGERSTILRKWFDLLMANQEDLGRLMTAEQGKPLAEAKGEVVYGASFIEWFAEEGKRVYGETIPTTDNNKRYLVIKQAMGGQKLS